MKQILLRCFLALLSSSNLGAMEKKVKPALRQSSVSERAADAKKTQTMRPQTSPQLLSIHPPTSSDEAKSPEQSAVAASIVPILDTIVERPAGSIYFEDDGIITLLFNNQGNVLATAGINIGLTHTISGNYKMINYGGVFLL
jgi:hypothetical protein